MNTANWHWPQWVTFASMVLGLLISAALHGKSKVDREGEPYSWNGFVGLVSFGINAFVLYCGGFFR